MAICQIKRDKSGDIERVLAANGRESLAYKGLLDRLNSIANTITLRERFKSWEGKHIMPITNKRELAIALYKSLYSPAFKSWMGDWSKLARVSSEDPGNGYLIEQLKKTVRVNLLDQNNEPKDEALDKIIEGPKGGAYRQVGGPTQPSPASPTTLKKVQEFVNRLGIKVETLQEIKVNGQKIGATGLAIPIQALIQITEGNIDTALTEEAMHIAVELIQQKDPKLFKEMFNQVGNYNLFTQVIREYKDIKDYQTADGKPDIPKLKKETIAKILAQTIIDKNQGASDNPAFLAQAKNWWDKIIDFLKLLFNRAGFNPFEATAENILQGKENLGKVSDLQKTSQFFQAGDNPNIVRANMKLVSSLQDPRAEKWFKDLYLKGDKETFFNKLQRDLQAPKQQVEMLKNWAESNSPSSAEDMKIAVMAEMSYTVEIGTAMNVRMSDNMDWMSDDYDTNKPSETELVPSDLYEGLTVPGGTNYRENEIRTPNITPEIKVHHSFAGENAIGWFRSDEAISSETTRRILEVQSDLFQKGRNRDILAAKGNDFLQLLNKDNNWVTFFVKSIIQNSAKKGYKEVLFPAGKTASDIQGHEDVETFIKNTEEVIELAQNRLNIAKEALVNEGKIHNYSYNGDVYKENGRYYKKGYHDKTGTEITRGEYLSFANRTIEVTENTIRGFNRDLEQARNGTLPMLAVPGFYENTLQSVLKKQGYSPNRITDEHGNDWFSVSINQTRDLSDFYYQLEDKDVRNRVVDKVKDVDKNVAEKEDGTFEVNGNKIKNNVMDKVAEYLKTKLRGREPSVFAAEFKQSQDEANDDMHTDLDDILDRYIDDNGNRRPEELEHVNPSAIDPFDNTIYNTLEAHIRERLDSYPAETVFFKSVNLYDGINTAGKADMLAFLPDGKVDILQFKVPDVRFVATDIPLYKQEAYNVEIEGLRKILQTGYGIKRSDFRYTRVIPIKARYATESNWQPGMPEEAANTTYKVTELIIGNVNTKLVEDDTLLPIASTSETTGNAKLDKFISRLRGLVQRLVDERVTPDKRQEKTNRIASLLASIRKLQVQQNVSGILSSANVIIKRQQSRYVRLNDVMRDTNPEKASEEDLNRIAADILDEKDQVELYTDLYRVLKEILPTDTEAEREILQKARNVSEEAQSSVDSYWDLSVRFRTQKLASKFNIRDEFLPEKQLTWYRGMIRSLSQSSIKAGAILWHLVDKINSGSRLDFLERLNRLKKIEEKVHDWLKGRSIKELYSKVLQIDKEGRWNGKFIQQYSKDFYKELRVAQEKGGKSWVFSNIDVDAYRKWYEDQHDQVIENSLNTRVHEDDAENERRIKQEVKDFEDTFDIDRSSSINTRNYKLKDFPSDKWNSNEYNELKRPGNEAILELYNYWRNKLEESLELGMIEEHNGWSWFPNIRKNRIEKLNEGRLLSALTPDLRVEPEDLEFGKIDPLTGKPIDEVHANYVSDLGKRVKGTDGKYYDDYSEKSMDLFRVMASWEREIARYKLKIESESLARMLAYTEQGQGSNLQKGAYKQRDSEGNPIVIDNDINSRYIKEHIDAVYYGKGTSNESNVVIDIPVKAVAERINKFFGKEMVSVPTQSHVTMSGVKALEGLNRYFLTKTLGGNVLTAAANIFGGTVNTYINQGKFFTKIDVTEAEMEMISGRFYKDEKSRKMAGLLSYFSPFLEDKSNEEIRKMSLSGSVKFFSSDHLFFMQRASDEHVNQVIGMSFIKNAMVKDGSVVNIREQARKELGYADKYNSQKWKNPQEFETALEKRVKELKDSPEALLNYAKIVDDHIEIPGMERVSNQSIQFRGRMLSFIKDALGNTSREDLSRYKRSVIMQSFFMFKNWIPRMVDVRHQSLKYNPGSQQYEWGRIKMLGNAVGYYLGGRVKELRETLGTEKGIVAVAKDMYKRKQQEFSENGEDFDMNEAEFIDMYIKGVRSGWKEIALGLGLMSMLIAARAAQPPRDDDPDKKGRYKWALRAIDKLQDEVTFFYSPSSFTDIVNGSIFPAVSILVDIEKLLKAITGKLFYEMLGDDQKASQQKVAKYVFKILPITKELSTYVAIFNNDFAKDYGIRVSSQNGSSR